MQENQIGCQTIGCRVTSCRHHGNGYCGLSRIQVEPCTGKNGSTGSAEDESLCGSYRPR